MVLAGGQGLRMGGADKGLLSLHGIPLAAHVMQRLQRQHGQWVQTVAVNANRNRSTYGQWGVAVWTDLPERAGEGPLSGLLSGLRHAPTPWLLTSPCDVPLLPLNLADRLVAALQSPAGAAAQAATVGVRPAPNPASAPSPGLRLHPLCSLWSVDLADDLDAFLRAGGRRVQDWLASVPHRTVLWDANDAASGVFHNVNSPDDLAALAAARPPPPSGT